MQYWDDYVRAAYELVMEGEGVTQIFLQNPVEFYVVHLFARNFRRTDLGSQPIAIKMLEASQRGSGKHYEPIADECLLIHSYPLKPRYWPTERYYQDMGEIAYGMAGNEPMEKSFAQASQVLHSLFVKIP
jgi:hypothetical protein